MGGRRANQRGNALSGLGGAIHGSTGIVVGEEE